MASPDKFSNILKQIKENTLTRLDLHVNQIGDAGAKDLATALQTNRSLTTLDLHVNQIGDAGAKDLATALQTNTSLTTLDLHGNQIGVEGAKALAEALHTNTSLTTLGLRHNIIGVEGATAFATALQTNTSLTTLDLRGNQIGDDILENILFRLRYNSLLKKWREIIKDKTEYKDGERQRKIYDTLHKDATKLLEDEYKKQIFTYKERKLILSWIQYIKSSSRDPLAGFFINVMNKLEEGHDKKPKNPETSNTAFDFLAKKKSANRKKSNQKRVQKSPKRGFARARRVKSKSKSLEKKVKRVSVRRAITSPRRNNIKRKSKSVPARERTKK